MPGDGWEGDRGGGTAGLDPWRGGAEAWRRVLPPSTQRGGVPCPPPPGAKARRRRRGEGIPLIPAEAGGPRARPGVCTRALCVRTWACMQITCAKCAGLPPPPCLYVHTCVHPNARVSPAGACMCTPPSTCVQGCTPISVCMHTRVCMGRVQRPGCLGAAGPHVPQPGGGGGGDSGVAGGGALGTPRGWQ